MCAIAPLAYGQSLPGPGGESDRADTRSKGSPTANDLYPVQQSSPDLVPFQCGYGQIVAAAALLKRNPNPTDDDIDEIENVCRCGSGFRTREAIKAAAARL